MLKHLAWLLVLFLNSTASAVPEVARFGHFTCVSCHVSSGGGGVLTSYGRTFATEKLSTWHFDGEEDPIHGLVPVSDRYLIGGDARWVDYRKKSGTSKFEKFWRMQTDIEAGLHVGPLWLTGVAGTKPAGPTDDPKDHDSLRVRGFAARIDLFDEHLMLRTGLFTPKFGLMLSDHTAYIRSMTGLGPNTEQSQVEAVYQTDTLEFTLAGLFEDHRWDRKGRSKTGVNIGTGIFVGDRSRLNFHALQTNLAVDLGERSMTALGVSGVLSFTKRLFAMLEVDRITNTEPLENAGNKKTHQLASYGTLTWEVYKGLLPYGRLEYAATGSSSSTQRWGAGINWYVRPHVQMEARALRTLFSAGQPAQDESNIILHYYL
jgi:hypothetical protein